MGTSDGTRILSEVFYIGNGVQHRYDWKGSFCDREIRLKVVVHPVKLLYHKNEIRTSGG